MSLRCSLLGHSYGEAEIEREREEQGSEVVVTVREFEACERCGHQNVVTENKEVTALESRAPDLESAENDPDVGRSPNTGAGGPSGTSATSTTGTEANSPTGTRADSATGTGVDSATRTGTGNATNTAGVSDSTDPDVTPDDDGAEIISDSTGTAGPADDATVGGTSTSTGDSSSSAPTSDTSPSASTSDTLDDSPGSADDDGVILDDEESAVTEGDRQPGEWPDAETTHPAEADDERYTDWPEVDQSDDGFDAEPGSASADVEFGGGLSPDSAPEVEDEESEEVEFINAEGDTLQANDSSTSDVELSSGISAGAEAPNLSGPAEDPGVDAEFVCPECDHREPVAGSSLRAGDICPECARGYLAQQ